MGKKVVGILGGMGPEATVDLMGTIVRMTEAKIDQDHLRILVDNNPEIPCRVKGIMGQGESPGPVMAKMAQDLERWGAEILVIPCNTAHYYLPQVEAVVGIPVLNMIKETALALAKEGVREAALLASSALLKTDLYQEALEKAGIKLILPSAESQEKLMKAIFSVKSANYQEAREHLQAVVQDVLEQGAKAVILGCTELPLIVQEGMFPVKLYNPTVVLAQALLREAKN